MRRGGGEGKRIVAMRQHRPAPLARPPDFSTLWVAGPGERAGVAQFQQSWNFNQSAAARSSATR